MNTSLVLVGMNARPLAQSAVAAGVWITHIVT